MHKLKFYFIDKFEKKHLARLDKNISIIYRNYYKEYNENEILEIKKFCLTNKRSFFISNNLELANKMKLDGIYIPSFNKDLSFIKKKDRRLKVLGSAHNFEEIVIKKRQKVDFLFISPIFKTNKSSKFLDIYKFNIFSKFSKKKVIALGGINKSNIKKINMVRCSGYAGISHFLKK